MHQTKGLFTEPDGTLSMRALTAPLKDHMLALDSFMEAEIGQFEPELRELVRYTFAHSGKRLRPILTFFGGWTGGPPDAGLVKCAAIVEMVHLATLVHDDILDGATLRHNAPTSVAANGAHVAVLLGDALFSEALRLAAGYDTTEVCRVVAQATRRVCAGEVGQTFQRGNDRLNLATYYRVIELKTAELFRAACYLGALIGGHGQAFADAADNYGLHLGTAYQIFDDVADLLGDENAIGKTLGTDLASGKFTLPLLLLMQGLGERERAELKTEIPRMDTSRIFALLAGGDVISKVKTAFNDEVKAATDAIEPYAELPPVEPLRVLASYVGAMVARIA
ncbi:MAG: polyprenyl synthetase family protein [Opitutales bacterium]